MVRSGLDKVYNFEFAEAEEVLRPVLIKYKDHPVSYLLKATILQWQNDPIGASSKQKEYITILEKCISLSENLLRTNKFNSEATFYLLTCHGYIAKLHHFNNDYIKAGLEAKKAYSYLKDGFAMVGTNPDFLLTNGLYLFYREQYPETHPSIRPIIYFFKSGNKKEGLMSLQKATEKALFSQLEAKKYLGGILLKYENNNSEALRIFSSLNHDYPRNPDFQIKFCEALIANKKWAEARIAIEKLKKFSGADAGMAYLVFKGISEFEINDKMSSSSNLFKSLQIKGHGNYTDDLKSMCYLYLGKISIDNKDLAMAKEYLEDCLAIAEYSRIKREANLLLQQL